MDYRVRCSELPILIGDCGKIRGKFEWTQLDNMNEAHIKLAVKIFNNRNGLFTPADICTLDMSSGKELEPDAILMYDKFHGTDYHTAYEENRAVLSKFERSNEYLTGTRDFGDDKKTFDCKISTDKNIFDLKKFTLRVDNDPLLTIQVNGYGWLYGTGDNYLFNALMPASMGQIKKHVDSKRYIEMLSDEQADEYQMEIEANYGYRFLEIEKRIDIKPIPIIYDFEEIVKKRVTVLNNWIDSNRHKL